MIIELYGLPGSGKTYFFQKSSFEKIEIRNNFEKIYYCLKYRLKHPIFTSYLLIQLIKNIDSKNGSFARIFIHKLLGNYMLCLAKYGKYESIKKENKNYLIDEGFIQLIFAIYDNKNKNIKKTCNKVFKYIDKVKIVKISEVERKKRLKERGIYPREHFGKRYYDNWSKNSIITHNEIMNFLKTKKNILIEK